MVRLWSKKTHLCYSESNSLIRVEGVIGKEKTEKTLIIITVIYKTWISLVIQVLHKVKWQ